MNDINENEEELYKSKLVKIHDFLEELGYVRIGYSLKAMLLASIEKHANWGPYDYRRIQKEDFLEINVMQDEGDGTTWLNKRVFEEWPDNELYDELVEKGLVKDEE